MLRLILRRGDGVYSTILVSRAMIAVPEGLELVGVEMEARTTAAASFEVPEETKPVAAGQEPELAKPMLIGEVSERPEQKLATELWLVVDDNGVPVPSTIRENDRQTVIACTDFQTASELRDYQKVFGIRCSAVRIR